MSFLLRLELILIDILISIWKLNVLCKIVINILGVLVFVITDLQHALFKRK